jgi:hypothetical protein
MTRMIASCLALTLLCVPSAAEDKKKPPAKKGDPLKELVQQLGAAFGKGSMPEVKAALARAQELRGNYDDKKYAAVAKAVAKGFGHKQPDIAIEAVTVFGQLNVKGSSKSLGKLLSPPAKIPDAKLPLHIAAIRAAGAIHETATLKTLEKTLTHPHPKIGATAAEALTAYRSLDEKPRYALAKRLLKTLAGLEKKAASSKEQEKAAAEPVRAALVETLRGLTGESDLNTAAHFEKWLKTAGKKSKADS